MGTKAILRISLAIALAIGVTALGMVIMAAHPLGDRDGEVQAASVNDQEKSEQIKGMVITVKSIHAMNNPAFSVFAEAPAFVRPYYRAEVCSRLAGRVEYIVKDKGDKVRKNEILIKISVPDLEAQVLQKKALVAQKEKELLLAEQKVAFAKLAVETAKQMIAKKEADINIAQADEDYRKSEWKRWEKLAKEERAVAIEMVDEKLRYYKVAKATTGSARVAVKLAESDLLEKKAKVAEAEADVELKKTLVDVAKMDLKHTKELLGYTQIPAPPFDGEIVKRRVDLGSFVQSSTSGVSSPLLVVDRTDIVTIAMKLPDNYAPYVTENTEAIIQMGELPGQLIHGKVTRFARTLQNQARDRTMLVEVDLWNCSAEAYQQFMKNQKNPETALILKGGKAPLMPKITGKLASVRPHRLLPGMYGTMQLILREFKGAFLVPSYVLVSKGGKHYIYIVKDCIACLTPVEVEMDDGNLAKILIITKEGNDDVTHNLTGKEEIVASNQGELMDGQAVTTTRVEWKP